MRIRDKVARRRVSAVSATEAAKNFGRLVDRVREHQVSYLIERSGTPVAQIGPVESVPFTMADFKALIGSAPRADADYLRALDAVVARHARPVVRRTPWGR
jgi:prevent-host-death family protein